MENKYIIINSIDEYQTLVHESYNSLMDYISNIDPEDLDIISVYRIDKRYKVGIKQCELLEQED